MSASPRAVVVGGGLAGISAALDLADAGCAVTLLERRRRLGGLTWSYAHGDRTVDNGQHVFLRCCTAYLEWLDRIGSAGDVTLQPRLDITVLRPTPDGHPSAARLRRRNLPAPLHLAGALATYGHLPLSDRARIGLAAIPLRTLDLTDPALDDESFGSWLRRHGQSERAIRALWDLITVPTVNLCCDDSSLAVGAKVFQTGLLGDADAADIGWAQIPLGVLHGQRSADALEKAGVAVLLDARVTSVTARPTGVQVVTSDATIDADVAVVAVPHTEVADLLGAAAPGGSDRLGTSAIVDVHLTFDRPVTGLEMFAALDSPVEWVFDRTASSGLRDGPGDRRQYLAVSLSAADGRLGTRPEALAGEITDALRRLLPGARQAQVVDSFVTKERTATFRAAPGSGRLRPGPRTTAPGVYLAGAWTDTGWPATMEGALRSGRRAARAALVGVGRTRNLPQEVP